MCVCVDKMVGSSVWEEAVNCSSLCVGVGVGSACDLDLSDGFVLLECFFESCGVLVIFIYLSIIIIFTILYIYIYIYLFTYLFIYY